MSSHAILLEEVKVAPEYLDDTRPKSVLAELEPVMRVMLGLSAAHLDTPIGP